MRTAEEIMSDNFCYGRGQDGAIIKCINEARKEAIEECAKRAKIKSDNVEGKAYNYRLDKKSILSLIDELK